PCIIVASHHYYDDKRCLVIYPLLHHDDLEGTWKWRSDLVAFSRTYGFLPFTKSGSSMYPLSIIERLRIAPVDGLYHTRFVLMDQLEPLSPTRFDFDKEPNEAKAC